MSDSDFSYAYYCFHKIKMLPSQYAELDIYEKAMIIAFINKKLEDEKEAERKAKSKRK